MSTAGAIGGPRADSATVGGALARAAARLNDSDTARLDAEVLLAHVLGRPRAYLLAHAERALAAAEARRFESLIASRRRGWPVAYLTGRREFWSHPFSVTADTLIPRPETERLVELALARIPEDNPWRVADLGTGCGAIAVAIALERPRCRVLATDASSAALEVARHNAGRLGAGNVEFCRSDWLRHLSGRHFELIVSNPPYVRRDDPHLAQGDVRYEPAAALSAGEDGLEAIGRIAAEARAVLGPGGRLLIEHGHDQSAAVAGLMARHGYRDIERHMDLGGVPRVVEAATGSGNA